MIASNQIHFEKNQIYQILANSIIVLTGILVWFASFALFSYVLGYYRSGSTMKAIVSILALIVPNILAGSTVGIIQWKAIFKKLIPLFPWLLASIIGWLMIVASPMFYPITGADPLADSVYTILVRSIMSGIVGLFQWAMLRTRIQHAWQWPFVSVSSTVLAWLCFDILL